MRSVVLPAELDFETPGRRDHWVALGQDSIWGDHLVPLTILVGPEARAGQGVVAFGGTHGNEYEAPIALRHVLQELDPARVRGRIVILPVLNVAAFRAGARDSVGEDRVNLNRAFVDGAGAPPLGGITHRIAAFVRAWIWPQVHVVLDLHAGGDVARFLPCASFHAVDDAAQHALIEATARDFGTPAILTYQNETPGLLTSEAERLGKITVGGEFGWGGAVQPQGVGFVRRGVLAAFARHGQYAGALPPPVPGQLHLTSAERDAAIPAPFGGHYEPLVECGDRVARGDAVGLLHDFERFDLSPEPIRAGLDGVVVAQAWGAPVRQGQHVAVIGRVLG